MCIVCWAFAAFSAVGSGGDDSAVAGVDGACPLGGRPAPVGDWFSRYAQSGGTDSGLATNQGYDSHYRQTASPQRAVLPATDPGLLKPGEERYLRSVRQLTFGQPAGAPEGAGAANYAEAYWSPDGKSLVLQSTRGPLECDHIFTLDLLSNELKQVSSGAGRTTCSFFYDADGGKLIYSSTHETLGADCPPRPDMSLGYVWPVFDYNIYLADAATGAIERNLSGAAGAGSYNAEGTIDWQGGWLYFTSTRDGDLDIYRQHLESGEVQRLTDEFGYDGGPFISYDGQTVVYRRDRLDTDEERQDYAELLAHKLVRPGKLEIWAMDADGSNKRQLTDNGTANFAPFLHPDGETVIFCSNVGDTQSGRRFELWAMPLDGSHEPVQVTQGGEFDGFPMFSPDGDYIVWCSNRNGAQPRETNVFIAQWLGINWDE